LSQLGFGEGGSIISHFQLLLSRRDYSDMERITWLKIEPYWREVTA